MKGQKRLGVLINTLYSDYSVAFLKGIDRYCKEHDCMQYVFPLAHGKNSGLYDYHSDSNFDFITEKNIDALVIVSSTLSGDRNITQTVEKINSLSPALPKVSAGLQLSGFPYIKVDGHSAIRKLVNHLIMGHGCKKFLLIRAAAGNIESDERERSFRSVLAQNGIHLEDSEILNGNFVFDHTMNALSNYYKNREIDLDACICFNDSMAMSAMKFFESHGLRVPDDVIVTGYDNIYEASSNELDITTIDQKIDSMAYKSAEMAIALTEGKEVPQSTVMESIPVFRGSCRCPLANQVILNRGEDNRSVNETVDLLSSVRTRNDIFRRSSTQLYMLHYFLMETQTPLPLESLYGRIHYSFGLFDVQGAVLVLYNDPVYWERNTEFKRPHEATVVMNYSCENGFGRPNLKFDPNKNLLPSKVSKDLSGSYSVFPLFAESLQYGYIMIKFGNYEMIFYQSIFELLAKEIINSINISRDEMERLSLLNKNNQLEEHTEKLHKLSLTDDMTQILNRRGFYEYAQKLVDSTISNDQTGLVIFGDMDGLKKINDTFGHDAGDRAIMYEVRLLKKIFRSTDVLGRLGGDEFAIVAPKMKVKDFERIKKSLAVECEKLNKESEEPFKVSISLGSAEFTSENSHLDKLLTQADSAQYEEKRSKKANG